VAAMRFGVHPPPVILNFFEFHCATMPFVPSKRRIGTYSAAYPTAATLSPAVLQWGFVAEICRGPILYPGRETKRFGRKCRTHPRYF
jgi:hypothetical protein